jgi:hypothetical protein
MAKSTKSRLVVLLNKATKNELAWLALKERMTMTAYLEARIHEDFMAGVPQGFDICRALGVVADDDFEPGVTIPFE